MQCRFLMLELGSAAGESTRSYLTAGPIKLKVPAHSPKSRHRTSGAEGWFPVRSKPVSLDFGLILIGLQMEFLRQSPLVSIFFTQFLHLFLPQYDLYHTVYDFPK